MIFLLLLVLGCGEPASTSADAGSHDPSAPSAWRDVGAPAALTATLDGLPQVVGRAARDEAATCTALREVITASDALNTHLRASAPLSPAVISSLKSGIAQTASLTLSAGAVQPSWTELDLAVGRGPAGAAIVTAGGWLAPTGAPWAKSTSRRVCMQPTGLRVWGARTASVLERAPACVTAALTPVFETARGEISAATCFCGDDPQAMLAAASAALPSIGGEVTISQLQERVASGAISGEPCGAPAAAPAAPATPATP